MPSQRRRRTETNRRWTNGLGPNDPPLSKEAYDIVMEHRERWRDGVGASVRRGQNVWRDEQPWQPALPFQFEPDM